MPRHKVPIVLDCLSRQEFDHGVRIYRKADVASRWNALNVSSQCVRVERNPLATFAFNALLSDCLIHLQNVLARPNSDDVTRSKQVGWAIDLYSVHSEVAVGNALTRL